MSEVKRHSRIKKRAVSPSDISTRCYRCGRAPFEQLRNGEYWCSWCGQAFHPKDAAEYREEKEKQQKMKEEAEQKWEQELQEIERRDRASQVVINGTIVPYCDPLWVQYMSGRKVVALCDLEYGVAWWSNAMNWHHDDKTRPDSVIIPKGTTGRVRSFDFTLRLVAIRWRLGLLRSVLLWYDEGGFVGQVGVASVPKIFMAKYP